MSTTSRAAFCVQRETGRGLSVGAAVENMAASVKETHYVGIKLTFLSSKFRMSSFYTSEKGFE